MNDYRVHLGIDISSEIGAPVRAFSDGVIEKIYKDHFMGKTIVINHGNGLKSYYMNLSDTLPDGIAEGVTVTPGTLIGAVGETAMRECADSPHLHFEIRLNDKLVDPTPYIKK
jgi:murein DD-endopeptidase MepM/ murein hydrolase activator NlpD